MRKTLTERRAEVVKLLEAEWVAAKSGDQNRSLKQLKRQQADTSRLAKSAVDVVGKLKQAVDKQAATVGKVASDGKKLASFASSSAGPHPSQPDEVETKEQTEADKQAAKDAKAAAKKAAHDAKEAAKDKRAANKEVTDKEKTAKKEADAAAKEAAAEKQKATKAAAKAARDEEQKAKLQKRVQELQAKLGQQPLPEKGAEAKQEAAVKDTAKADDANDAAKKGQVEAPVTGGQKKRDEPEEPDEYTYTDGDSDDGDKKQDATKEPPQKKRKPTGFPRRTRPKDL